MNNIADVFIIGGGPAGLSASIQAASKGLKTYLCDSSSRFGGQAGQSSLIENFIGFPEGISGEALTQKAVAQADKFGVHFLNPWTVTKLEMIDDLWYITNDDEQTVVSKTVLLTMGVSYRSLEAPGITRYAGMGISYGSPLLSENYNGKNICIIGGANSAGQAATHLANCKGCTVTMIVRAESIEKSMSDYLSKRVRADNRIKVICNSEIVSCEGNGHLSHINIKTEGTDEITRLACDKMFILIGAKPKTSWLKGIVPLDEHGFIRTGEDAGCDDCQSQYCKPGYILNSFETVPGVFAAGDIRRGSINSVSAAVGEGAYSITNVSKYLSSLNQLLEGKEK